MNIKKGDKFATNSGVVIVREYISSREVRIYFEGYINHTFIVQKGNLLGGWVKNPYKPSVYGVGYLGEGVYKRSIKSRDLRVYRIWSGMLGRCYNQKISNFNRYGGRGVTVCPSWHNFQKFAGWYYSQRYSEDNSFQIDKDLTVIGGKVYSPTNCSFIPMELNALLTANNVNRGDTPVGVCLEKSSGKYLSQCNNHYGKEIKLGRFTSPQEAFIAYKGFKEGLLKELANKYFSGGSITQQIKDNLLNLEIIPYPE